MTEKLVLYWYCNRCDRGAKRGTFAPSGWHEASDRYGNTVHCCPDHECEHWMRRFCEMNGLELPSGLRPKPTAEAP